MTRSTRVVSVADTSSVAEARRAAAECAKSAGLGETSVARAALVATELATNLVKHGDGGSLLINEEDGRPALTVLAVDKGRGFRSTVQAAMQDGYSTAGSPGTGLGAIDRASVDFDVYSMAGKGSVVWCRIEEPEPRTVAPAPRPHTTVSGVCVPARGESEAGDAWEAVSTAETTTIVVADGLGHGPSAATASVAAVRVLRERAGETLQVLMQDMHGALRATRGAAVAIARIHPGAGTLDYIGVGNISASIYSDAGVRRAISQNGIVGHEMRRGGQVFSFPWTPSSMLAMYSDGLTTSWNLDGYPGLMARHPSMIAAVLYRDYCRGSDDATVVVAKPS